MWYCVQIFDIAEMERKSYNPHPLLQFTSQIFNSWICTWKKHIACWNCFVQTHVDRNSTHEIWKWRTPSKSSFRGVTYCVPLTDARKPVASSVMHTWSRQAHSPQRLVWNTPVWRKLVRKATYECTAFFFRCPPNAGVQTSGHRTLISLVRWLQRNFPIIWPTGPEAIQGGKPHAWKERFETWRSWPKTRQVPCFSRICKQKCPCTKVTICSSLCRTEKEKWRMLMADHRGKLRLFKRGPVFGRSITRQPFRKKNGSVSETNIQRMMAVGCPSSMVDHDDWKCL